MTSDTHSAFVTAVIDARRGGERYRRDPDHEPGGLPQAFAAQAAVARALGAEVGGWKVGFSPDGQPVAAPMFRTDFHAAGARVPLLAQGRLIVEVELAFRLARDLPRRDAPYARAEILDAVECAMIGLELVAGRVGESSDVPFPVWLADNIGNLGYAIGGETRDFRGLDLTALHCRLRLGGRTVHDAVGGHPQHDPVEPFRAWASLQCDSLGGLRRGQVVTTGSLTGATRVPAPARVEAELGGIGTVTLDVTSPA